jgi:hypothetical protein
MLESLNLLIDRLAEDGGDGDASPVSATCMLCSASGGMIGMVTILVQRDIKILSESDTTTAYVKMSDVYSVRIRYWGITTCSMDLLWSTGTLPRAIHGSAAV